jgi:hypothetical protein
MVSLGDVWSQIQMCVHPHRAWLGTWHLVLEGERGQTSPCCPVVEAAVLLCVGAQKSGPEPIGTTCCLRR